MHCTKIIIIVPPIATKYNPAPQAIPIPAVAHIPAAVVKPCTAFFLYTIIPAPIKPIPETICAATLATSAFDSENPYFEIIIKRHAPKLTIVCVLTPASFARVFLSIPIQKPKTTERSVANKYLYSIKKLSNI